MRDLCIPIANDSMRRKERIFNKSFCGGITQEGMEGRWLPQDRDPNCCRRQRGDEEKQPVTGAGCSAAVEALTEMVYRVFVAEGGKRNAALTALYCAGSCRF